MKNRIVKILKSDWSIILLLFAFSIIIKVIIPQVFSFRGHFWSDDATYAEMARNIKEGNPLKVIHPQWPPLYPFVSFLLEKITGNWYAAGVAASVIANCLLPIPIFFIVKKFTNRLFAFISAIAIFAFLPLNILSLNPLSEPLYIFLFWLSLALGIYSLETKKIYLPLLTGFSFGLATLTRSEGILTFVSFFIVFCIIALWKKSLAALFILLSFLLIFGSYQALLFHKYGQNVSTAKAAAFLKMGSQIQLNSDKTSTFAQDIYGLDTFNVNSEFLKENLISYISRRYPILIWSWSTRIKIFEKYLFNEVLSPVQIYLTGFGLLFLILQLKKKQSGFLLLSILMGLVSTLFFAPIFEKRYVSFFLPLITILLIFGVYFFFELAKKKIIKILILTCFFIYLLCNDIKEFYFFIKTLHPKPIVANEIYNNPEFNNLLKGKKVMLVHEGFAFNPESKIIYTPLVTNLEDLVEYAEKKGADYFIATPGELPTHLNFLLTKPDNYLGLKPVFGSAEFGLVVYEIQNKK